MTKRPIVHPTDFSSASRPAFAKAIELAKARGSALLVLHVLNPSLPLPIGERIHLTSHVRAAAESVAGVGAQAAGSVNASRQGRESPIGCGSPGGRRGDRGRAPGAIPACRDDRHGNSRPDRDRAVRPWQRRGACLDSGPVPGPYRTRAMSLPDNSHHLAHAPCGA
jgi:hypothetical protein